MDVHPVILAGGSGTTSGLYPLNESFPKALLPVGNHPLIYYTLKLLENNNFKEVTVLVNGRDYKSISLALDTYTHIFPNSLIKATPIQVPPDGEEEAGSATALNALRSTGRIKSDLLVLSCDVIANVSLHYLWERHVTLGSAISLLLVQQSINTDDNKKLKTTEPDLIGLTSEGQVVFHSSLADVEVELKLNKKLLTKIPHFVMHSNLLDSHIYIISKWVLDYMCTQPKLKHYLSFKREVLPYFIKHQHSKELQELALSNQDSIDQWSLSYSSYPYGTTPTSHPVQCHAHTITDTLCMRVNTVPLYMEANRIIFQHFPSFLIERGDTKPNTVSGDSVISEGTQWPERSSVKRSMIGRHCVIGEKVKIINSIVMDHVTIGEGCIVQNTILCHHSHLEDRVTLRDCTVGSRVTINSKAEHKGELLVEGSELDF